MIADGEYPLKFMTAAGLEVAAVAVPSMQLLDILISLKNTTKQPLVVNVGPVVLSMLRPRARQLERLDPDSIDSVLEEWSVWSWTYCQPSLSGLQQNTIVPISGGRTTLSRQPIGGNVFGRYGQWTVACAEQSMQIHGKTQLEPAVTGHEQNRFLAPLHNPNSFVIGPMESRSGLVFFKNPRGGDVVLRVFVGNASFSFPFHLPQ